MPVDKPTELSLFTGARQAAESLAVSCSDGAPSAMSNGTTMRNKSSRNESKTASLTTRRSSLTCASSHNVVQLESIADLSMWLQQDSRANHSQSQAKAWPVMTNAICGRQLVMSSRLYDHQLRTLRTRRDSSAQGTLFESSKTLSASGTGSNARYILEQMTLERSTTDNEYGFTLPTPTTNERSGKQTPGSQLSLTKALNGYTKNGQRKPVMIPTILASECKGSARNHYVGSADYSGNRTSGVFRTSTTDPIYLNPLFGEAMMLWPIGHAALEPLAMDKFQSQWLRPLRSYLHQIIGSEDEN